MLTLVEDTRNFYKAFKKSIGALRDSIELEASQMCMPKIVPLQGMYHGRARGTPEFVPG